jgi:hypothetical protein
MGWHIRLGKEGDWQLLIDFYTRRLYSMCYLTNVISFFFEIGLLISAL